MGMRNDVQNAVQGGGGSGLGFIPTSFKAMSSYLRIVSSGASSVASTVKSAASAASAMVDRDSELKLDQVQWAGFDKLECEGGLSRLVLLLGYRRGFQVWDVEDENNVRNLVSKQDGPVSVLQLLPNPIASKQSEDKFAHSRPMLILSADESLSGGPYDGELPHIVHVPTVVWFYSLKSHSYVHNLKFRSVIHMVRCSCRVIAVLQASQIHCFDAATLEKDYTILTHPVVMNFETGGLGIGPLALGPRWMAYSGSPVDVSSYGRVSPQKITPSTNGSFVSHYAKESTKQIAAGIVTLGDMGYKKLSKYCYELLPDGTIYQTPNVRFHDADNIGMVIVRDTVKKSVVTQFRAHTSPISSLCFDPSGTLLVTASVHGHNINVFRIIPSFSENSSGEDSGASYIHLYKLQRGVTCAVIQDISFSRDSEWILISSSRGTSHLFAIPQSVSLSTGPVALSVVSRIRSGNNGWRQAVSGATSAATGRMKYLSVAVAAAFHNFNGSVSYRDASFLKANNNLLVFSSPGFLIQHAWRRVDYFNNTGGPDDTDERVAVEAIRKWNINHKQNYKDRDENIDIYGENGSLEKHILFGARLMVSKEKSISEERYHMFIAEVELHMHDHKIPLWAKSGMQFQTMVIDGMDMDIDLVGGDVEIERISVRIIEANSKELVPIFDYVQAPKIQLGRMVVSNGNSELHRKSRVLEGSKLGSLTDSDSSSIGVPNDYLNNDHSPEEANDQNGIVNNREKTQFVNSSSIRGC